MSFNSSYLVLHFLNSIFGDLMILTSRHISCISGLLLLITGCGGSTQVPSGQVNGTVTYEGAPITEGVVSFYSPDLGIGASADIGEAGAYAITEPLKTGSYSVTILPPPEPPPQDAIPVSTKKEYKNIPLKYRDPKKSELSLNITEGDNLFDVNMTK